MFEGAPAAVVSLLPPAHYHAVEQLWDELEAKFTLNGVRGTPYPHFSYLVARRLHQPAVQRRLTRLAARSLPFSVETTGVHVFPGPVLTVFLGVRRSPRLVRFHRAVRRALGGTSVGSSPFYRPPVWVPHITLAEQDIRPSQLPDVLQFLARKDLRWTLPVTSVTAFWENQGAAILGPTFSFSLTK